MYKMQKKGFTLVELLVVISIIALLISIIMPALSKVKEKARDVLCATNMHQWGLAVRTYSVEHDGYFPPMGEDPVRDSAGLVWVTYTMQHYFFPKYLFRLDEKTAGKRNIILFCPTEEFHRTLYKGDLQSYIDNGLIGYDLLFGNDAGPLSSGGGYEINYTLPTCPNALNWVTRKKMDGVYSRAPIIGDVLQSDSIGIGPDIWNLWGVPISTHPDKQKEGVPRGGYFLFEDGHVKWYKGIDNNGLNLHGEIGISADEGGWLLYFALPGIR